MQILLDRERANQLRAGRRLEYFTLAWNLGEAAVAIGAGLFAGSIALIGFGADSLIESLSGGILVWRLLGNFAGARLWGVRPHAWLKAFPRVLPSAARGGGLVQPSSLSR